MGKFIFGRFEYDYDLIRQKRKTLSLTVTPELKIILKSPIEASDERLESFLVKKWFWLEKQLKFFKKYQRKTYKREYVSGEAFLYLGRQYRLLIKRANNSQILLRDGKLRISGNFDSIDNEYAKKIVREWYGQRTKEIFNQRIIIVSQKFGIKKRPDLVIKKMNKRWGSYLKSGKIILNPKLVQVPKDCIDYVITHELCHSKHKNHDNDFFRLLDEKYPNWQKTKEKLEIIGASLN